MNPGPIEPAVEVLDVEEASRQREQQESLLRTQRMEKEQEMLMRITQQMATKSDLENIAKKISNRLYGKLTQPEVKQEEEEPEDHEAEDAKHKKHKKEKKEKSRKKSKKKKGREEPDVKKEWIEEAKAKKEAEDG